MRTLILCLVIGLLLHPALFAQKDPVRFGDVSKEEISMTTYDKDSTASAVILADFGSSTIAYRKEVGFILEFEHTTRIKILTKEGLEWGNFTIPLYKSGSDDEKISGLKAVTYNLEDGKIVESKLKNDGTFKENYDANHDLIKVTCPNVKEGSVVEISYQITSPFLFNFQDWSFQSTIPTIVSEYRAQIPEYFNYDRYMQGYIALDVVDQTRQSNAIRISSFDRVSGRNGIQSQASTDVIEYLDTKYRWVATHVPAFKAEPYMASSRDYISRINFELAFTKFPNQPVKQYMGSWEDINRTMSEDENFGGEVTGNGFLRKTVEEITTGLVSAEDQIRAITNYVKQNVVWDGNQRLYPSSPLRKVLENKKGSSAEINLLLASMLDKSGIKSFPVLLSTRNNGLLREATPVLSQFNYVICMVQDNDKTFLLDATEKLLPVGMLPERCLNGKGFVVSKEGFKWVPLETRAKTRSFTACEFKFVEGALQGKLKFDWTGYAALKNRKKFLVDGESEYLKDFVGSHAWEVKSTSIVNANDIQKSFVQEHEVIVNENVVVAGDLIYLDPFIYISQKENPFKSEAREYPVDFGSPMEQTFMLKLTIPENYAIDELPKSKILTLPENTARYVYNVGQTGNEITITSMFHINKSLFSQVEYPNLREFYNQVVAIQAGQIVLKRK